MVRREDVRAVLLGVLVAVLWVLYFAVCGAPTAAPFIYAQF